MNNSSGDFNIQIFISEDLVAMPIDGVPFTAAYAINGLTKYVILQGEEEQNGKQILVNYRQEDEEAHTLIEQTADIIVFWDDSIGCQK